MEYIKTSWNIFDSVVGGLPLKDVVHIQSSGDLPTCFAIATVVKALYQTDSSCFFVDSKNDFDTFYLKSYDILVEQNVKQNEILDTKKNIEWTQKGNFRHKKTKYYNGFEIERHILRNSGLKVVCVDINCFIINEQILNEKMEKSTDNTLYFIISDLKRIAIKYNISIIVIYIEDINANLKIKFTNYMKKVEINRIGKETKFINFDKFFLKVFDAQRQKKIEDFKNITFNNKYFNISSFNDLMQEDSDF